MICILWHCMQSRILLRRLMSNYKVSLIQWLTHLHSVCFHRRIRIVLAICHRRISLCIGSPVRFRQAPFLLRRCNARSFLPIKWGHLCRRCIVSMIPRCMFCNWSHTACTLPCSAPSIRCPYRMEHYRSQHHELWNSWCMQDIRIDLVHGMMYTMNNNLNMRLKTFLPNTI